MEKNSYNWYKKYVIAHELLKNAGFIDVYGKEMSVIIAVLMVIFGIEIGEYLYPNQNVINNIEKIKQNKTLIEQVKRDASNINKEDIERILEEHPQVVNSIQSMLGGNIKAQEEEPAQLPTSYPSNYQPLPTYQPTAKDVQAVPSNIKDTNLDKIVDLFIQHEGLLPGQTPFKITSPDMKKWPTIHGFQIDQTSIKPQNRQNFIFLKNPEDVHDAVKQQIIHYINNPSKYGLKDNPTLYDIIRKFDQTGAKNKVDFIIASMPEIDVHKPLSEMA